MKLIPTIVAVFVGVVFLAIGLTFDYEPSNEYKARTAVMKILLDPVSAEFDGVRSVKLDTARFVCGAVNGKNSAGVYVGPRAFIYDVATGVAAIDDDSQIVKSHNSFRPCPIAE